MKILKPDQFIDRYDHPGVVVLLEGKREVADSEYKKLIKLGRLLTIKTRHMRFRSGNAPGSDEFFSQGVSAVDRSRLEIITPYAGHRNTVNYTDRIEDLDQMKIFHETEVLTETRKNTKVANLVDQYASGIQNKLTMKAAYLLRDTVKVIGTSTLPAVSFAIFYDDPDNPRQGGTGHTMMVCDNNGVPYIDQTVWMDWIE